MFGPDFKLNEGEDIGTAVARVVNDNKTARAEAAENARSPLAKVSDKVVGLFTRHGARETGAAAGVGAPPPTVGMPATPGAAPGQAAPAATAAPAAGLPTPVPTPSPTAAPAAGLPSATPAPSDTNTVPELTVAGQKGGRPITEAERLKAQMMLAGQYGQREDVVKAATAYKDAINTQELNRVLRMTPLQQGDEIERLSDGKYTVKVGQGDDGQATYDIMEGDNVVSHAVGREGLKGMLQTFIGDNAEVGWGIMSKAEDSARAEAQLTQQNKLTNAKIDQLRTQIAQEQQAVAQGKAEAPFRLSKLQEELRVTEEAKSDDQLLGNPGNVWSTNQGGFQRAYERAKADQKNGRVWKRETYTDADGVEKTKYTDQIEPKLQAAQQRIASSPFTQKQIIRQAADDKGVVHWVVMDPKGQMIPTPYTDWRAAEIAAKKVYPNITQGGGKK
jgi:hypothetical protein